MRLSITTRDAYVVISLYTTYLQEACINCKIRLHPSVKLRVLRSKDKIMNQINYRAKIMALWTVFLLGTLFHTQLAVI